MVTLVLIAGAGATIWGLAEIEPAEPTEDVRVYADAEACVSGRVRTEADCRRDYAAVLRAYPNVAPRYETRALCEAHHGPGNCLTGESVGPVASGRFVPVLAGYVLGATAEQDLPSQPVFPHRPEAQAQSHSWVGVHGGYCTPWGGRVVPAAGGASSAARVSSTAVRSVAFGGFGATGRGVSAGSAHGGGG